MAGGSKDRQAIEIPPVKGGRPLTPLTSEEISGADDGLDTACIKRCEEQLQGKTIPSLEEVRRELSPLPGSLTAEIIAERDE